MLTVLPFANAFEPPTAAHSLGGREARAANVAR
jgi:hypothetical protein